VILSAFLELHAQAAHAAIGTVARPDPRPILVLAAQVLASDMAKESQRAATCPDIPQFSLPRHEQNIHHSKNYRVGPLYVADRGAAACPLWVNSRHLRCKTSCPQFTRKRTSTA
jgi:hypothetical protein